MFLIKAEANTGRADDVRRHVLAWPTELASNASGWLGCTSGVSDAGNWILLLRFVSQEAARITSDLPEYEAWWRSCRRHLEGPPVVTESTHVVGILGGGSDEAHSVRIIEGFAGASLVDDGLRRLELLAAPERIGLIGGIVVWHDQERFTEVLYLTGDTARGGQLDPSVPLGHAIDQLTTGVRDLRVTALDKPWMTSPGSPRTRDTQ